MYVNGEYSQAFKAKTQCAYIPINQLLNDVFDVEEVQRTKGATLTKRLFPKSISLNSVTLAITAIC